MSAREMAVVGELVLNNGMYNGSRVISVERVDFIEQKVLSVMDG